MKPFPKGPALTSFLSVPVTVFLQWPSCLVHEIILKSHFFIQSVQHCAYQTFFGEIRPSHTFPWSRARPPTRQGSKGECEVEGGSESEHEGRKYAYVFTRCAPGDRRRGLFALRRQKIASRHRRKTTHSAWDSICFHRHRGGFSCAMFRAGCDAISNDITNERWARFCQTTDKAKG